MDLKSVIYPMISVDSAVAIILSQSQPLEAESVLLMNSCGRICGSTVYATNDFPTFPASIMDGYAVIAPIVAGSVFPVQRRVHAGDMNPNLPLISGYIAYITTGARIPPQANSVVKIEDTEKNPQNPLEILIKADIPIGMNIRQIGSDITKGEEIVGIGQTIEPAEIGLMACAGVINVMCIRKPIIGVMSTGDELVEYHQSPQESQIRDSNRPAIIASLERDGYLVRDFGIVYDMELRLEQQILNAVSECDVLITSGGVSMGDADLVKPLLAKLGTIHFGRLNMKPGKPTTFATIKSPDVKRNIMCFGLPGNPVSCLVTKALLIEPCLKRLQGLSMDRCISPQISVRIDSDLKLDLERPEYHRARINTWGMCNGSIPTASSTGDQKSSRLLSLRASNALLCLPQGSVSKSKIFTGEIVTALITGPLPSPPINGCIYKEVIRLLSNSTSINYNEDKKDDNKDRIVMKTALLTISDRASQGIYEDLSGQEMRKLLESMNNEEVKTGDGKIVLRPLDPQIVATAIVPDEIDHIQREIIRFVDDIKVDLILTSGGSGFGRRDVTPEAIRPLIHREAPGVAQALLAEGLKHTPLAVLSRPVVGTRNNTLICTLPGSVRAVRENFQALKPLLPRIMELLQEGECAHVQPYS